MIYKISTDCVPVRGAKRSVIIDLTRGRLDIITNEFFDILTQINGIEVEKAVTLFEDSDQMKSSMDFLLSNEYVFTTNNPACFPEFERKWDFPSQISNAILEYSNNLNNLKKAIAELAIMNCQFIEIFVTETNKLVSLLNINELQDSTVRLFNIYIPFNKNDLKTIYKYSKSNPRLFFYIHGTPENQKEKLAKKFNPYNVKILTECIDIRKDCGKINPKYFVVDISFYFEALDYNTCLNRKVCIDSVGNIKNCLSMTKSYGNIDTDSIASVINNVEFQELWSLSKDKIDTCKFCEFRYVCSDCRAFRLRSDITSKPSKCQYDPCK